MTIIDVHAHIYPDAVAGRAVSSIGDFYDFSMACGGTVDELIRRGDEAGITRFVVHSAAVTPNRVAHVNDFLMRSAAAHPDRFVGFGTLHPDMEDVEGELTRMRAGGLKGVKLHPDFQKFCLDDEKAVAMFRAMADNHMPGIIHTGDTRYPYSEPQRMARVLDKVPALRVICAHLGGWSMWTQGWQTLAGHPGVWVDTSSSLYAVTPDEAVEVIRRYGVDRVLFGTDYPMWDAADELQRFLRLPLTNREREMILHENAEAFLAYEV